ncbi:integrase [Streptomyces sp. V3I8]|nr:integrase [Streptomyces sp. V3I8]
MLYETAGRAEEILGVNIEELDFAGRRCRGKAKGARAKARCRGQAREDFAGETVYWDAGTARLLPRLLKGRTRRPVFVTHRRPGPGKVVSPRDVCPDTGPARLSYGQARALLDEHTAVRGPGTGWALHEYRHSALTRFGEQGASLLMLMAKSRRKKPENLHRCFKPSAEAITEVISLLAAGDARR